jgi:uncharacterized cupredoxin-like copper-binding protein
MPGRRPIRVFLTSLALSAAGLVGACSPAPTPAGPAPQSLSISARDLSFSSVSLTLRANAPVRLTLVNEGALEHDLTIEGPSADGRTIEGHAHSAGHSMATLPAGSVHVTAPGGQRATIDFTPKAGSFEFYCSVAGHREAGMRGTLQVS